jgi:prepilin-type N-terminal cleavage/methylation domain-containing protein
MNIATPSSRSRQRGFTLIELLATIGVVMVMASMAVPLVQSVVSGFHVRTTAGTVSGAIQTTRYQAINEGYPLKIEFSKTSGAYQLSTAAAGTCAAPGTWTTKGTAVPFARSGVALLADVTVQLCPNGAVSFTTGASPVVLAGRGKTASIDVSPFGNVKVTYAP